MVKFIQKIFTECEKEQVLVEVEDKNDAKKCNSNTFLYFFDEVDALGIKT